MCHWCRSIQNLTNRVISCFDLWSQSGINEEQLNHLYSEHNPAGINGKGRIQEKVFGGIVTKAEKKDGKTQWSE